MIDGVTVTLARHARQGARAAARRLGRPALLADFELSHLHAPPTAGTPAKAPVPASPVARPSGAPPAPNAAPSPAGG